MYGVVTEGEDYLQEKWRNECEGNTGGDLETAYHGIDGHETSDGERAGHDERDSFSNIRTVT